MECLAAPPRWSDIVKISLDSETALLLREVVATDLGLQNAGTISMKAQAEMIEKSLLELDFASLTRRTFTPSPAAWEDQVLYFLLLDRFSDGTGKRRLPGQRGPSG